MKFIQKASLLLLCMCFGMAAAQNPAQKKHEVQSGETLFSISRSYGVTVDAIRQATPQLGETLLAGQTINIPATQPASSSTAAGTTPATAVAQTGTVQPAPPQNPDCKQMYLVEKKETVYSIARKFGVTEDDLRTANPQIKKNKVKKGEYLCIPYNAAERKEIQQRRAQEQQRLAEELRKAEEAARHARIISPINVAVILPFDLDNGSRSKEARKMLDFYEGFLLSVDEMKQKGVSINIYAYEEKGSYASSIDSILNKPMMRHMHLIIGPMRMEHIQPLSRFAKQYGIPLVIPFSTKASVTAAASTVFQVNTLPSTLYNNVYRQFLERNANANIVFCLAGDKGAKPDFIIGFKNALNAQGVGYKTVDINALAGLKDVLATDRKNIIVPSSDSQTAFERLTQQMHSDAALANYNISLFGHPEWQTFSAADKQTMRKFHTSIYTTFYANTASTEVQSFNARFLKWFHRNQYQSTPLFGLLGYDIGRYFLAGLQEFGTELLQNVSTFSAPALQNPMHFEQTANGMGFVNTNMNIIIL